MDDYEKMGIVGGERTAFSAVVVVLGAIAFLCVAAGLAYFSQ